MRKLRSRDRQKLVEVSQHFSSLIPMPVFILILPAIFRTTTSRSPPISLISRNFSWLSLNPLNFFFDGLFFYTFTTHLCIFIYSFNIVPTYFIFRNLIISIPIVFIGLIHLFIVPIVSCSWWLISSQAP